MSSVDSHPGVKKVGATLKRTSLLVLLVVVLVLLVVLLVLLVVVLVLLVVGVGAVGGGCWCCWWWVLVLLLLLKKAKPTQRSAAPGALAKSLAPQGVPERKALRGYQGSGAEEETAKVEALPVF